MAASATCLNCGNALGTGAYCSGCGQEAHPHRTLGAWWHEALHGVLHVEGRIWSTLPMLAWRPGELTRRYIDGERRHFVAPFGLFLFALFATFATMGLTGHSIAGEGDGLVRQIENARVIDSDVARLETSVNALPPGSRERVRAQAQLNEARTARRLLRGELGDFDPSTELSVERQAEAAKGRVTIEADRRSLTVISNAIRKFRENPNLALYKLQNNSYKFAPLLVPLSLPFLWLLFPFSRRYGLYDHAVFITYSLAFMLLLATLLTLAWSARVPSGLLSAAAVLIPPVHIYRQLRGAYRLSRVGAAGRMLVLVAVAVFLVASFGVALLGWGLAGGSH